MNFKWSLQDYPIDKKHTVFSTFACGGGSTMGYKLAGYTVLGANDIDPKMAKIYQKNHNPKYYFLEDIRSLTQREDLPSELFELDILDGSPPCTTFSMAGKREKTWGESRKYVEGNVTQTLDDLYFRFIELANKLKPKIIVSENVSGLAKGRAKVYLSNIVKRFEEIGYNTQIFLLNAATMGVPQKRQRIFIIGSRKDLNLSKLELRFNEKPIKFGTYRTEKGKEPTEHSKKVLLYMKKSDKVMADIIKRINGKFTGFTHLLIDDNEICPTVISSGTNFRKFDKMELSDMDYILSSSFPIDYDFMKVGVKYVVGMSVPPLMMGKIAEQIKLQWLHN